jgi:hypothetical protein
MIQLIMKFIKRVLNNEMYIFPYSSLCIPRRVNTVIDLCNVKFIVGQYVRKSGISANIW